MPQIIFTWSHSEKAQVASPIVNIITKNDLISGKYIQACGHLAYFFNKVTLMMISLWKVT